MDEVHSAARFEANLEISVVIIILVIARSTIASSIYSKNVRISFPSGFSGTEGDSLLCGGITLMTHFMEQKLRQIVKKFLLSCLLSTKV